MTRDASDEARIDTTKAHPARRYNYWLGRKDNFAVDRESGDEIERMFPGIRIAAQANRDFLRRGVRYLCKEAGIRQFLDVGTGLPTEDNTHEVAQRIDAAARVVYVDNDPLVLTHARALLTSTDPGVTAYIDADLRHPGQILDDPVLGTTLDLSRPVGLLLVAVMHFLEDDNQAFDAVSTLMDAVAPGSFLVLSHATSDLLPADTVNKLARAPGRGGFTDRTEAQIRRFFDGLTLVPPGLSVVSNWRPEPGTVPPSAELVSVYGAVAEKTAPARPR